MITSSTSFQSTHPCGVRPVCHYHVCAPWCFNPRTRVGCDKDGGVDVDGLMAFQSTHPCGVRRSAVSGDCRVTMFQSTHPCGVRLINHNAPKRVRGFNPRTRVGCDKLGTICGIVGLGFNPRTRVGCDNSFNCLAYIIDVSIHAPVWGAT